MCMLFYFFPQKNMNEAFAGVLHEKLSELYNFDQKKMAETAKQVVGQLRVMKNTGVAINQLIFAKRVMHQFLTNHEFTLADGVIFNPFSEVIDYNYIFLYRSEFKFEITYKVKSEYVVVTMDRTLNCRSGGIVAVDIHEMPTFTEENSFQDGYMVEKLFCRLSSRMSKLWTQFKQSSSTGTGQDSPILFPLDYPSAN